MTQRLCYEYTSGTVVYFAIYDPATGKYWNYAKGKWVASTKSGKLRLAAEKNPFSAAGSTYYCGYDFSVINSSVTPQQYQALVIVDATSLIDKQTIYVARGQVVTPAKVA